MDTPVVAAAAPCEVELIEGKSYFFCTCGRSKKQPFCDGAHSGTSFTPHMFKAEKSKKAWLCQCKATGKKPFCDGSHKQFMES